jgi:gas vesicle protein
MAKRTKEKIALGLGLLAGGALGYWLNSDKGREVRTDVAEKTSEYSQKAKEQADQISKNLNEQAAQISNNLNQQAQSLSNNLNQAVDSSRDYITQASDAVRKQFESVEQKAQNASSDFQDGVNYALKSIQKKAKELGKQNGKG